MLAAMPTNAERFYAHLKSLEAIRDLVGLPEDADFDCKEWSPRPDAMRGSIAKAACGFTNATGGVIVIGMKAAGRGADTPDVVQNVSPVADRNVVAAEALDIVLKFVEPGIEGVQVKTIPDSEESPRGFVVIFIPPSEGAVRRSKADWRFYVRIASGTLPMEYFQVEERFGRRPLPRLVLYIKPEPIQEGSGSVPERLLLFGLDNRGRGIAKFAGIRFARARNIYVDRFGIDGNGGFGLPTRASEQDWIVFRGGVDDVIYPGETRLIGKLKQIAIKNEERVLQPYHGFVQVETVWLCESLDLAYEISAESLETVSQVYQLTSDQLVIPSRVTHR